MVSAFQGNLKQALLKLASSGRNCRQGRQVFSGKAESRNRQALASRSGVPGVMDLVLHGDGRPLAAASRGR
jgi:hypothetical protein